MKASVSLYGHQTRYARHHSSHCRRQQGPVLVGKVAAACNTTAPRQAAGRSRQLRAVVLARRPRRGEYDADYVEFDDEEDWEDAGSAVQAPGLGRVLSTALRGLSVLTDKLTDVALQLAPADASPGVVRVAVSSGLVLLALSFVKSLLSFFLTLGTIILGAYVAVQVFGVDVAGVGAARDRDGGDSGGKPRPRQQQRRQRLDPRARQSEFKGLLGSGGGEEDGLLDVWFERKGGSSKGGNEKGSRTGGERARRR